MCPGCRQRNLGEVKADAQVVQAWPLLGGLCISPTEEFRRRKTLAVLALTTALVGVPAAASLLPYNASVLWSCTTQA